MSKDRSKWDFSTYVYEIEYLSEILEIPGAAVIREKLVKEVGQKFPKQWKELTG